MDTGSNTITGKTSSFSEFVVAESTLLEGSGGVAYGLNTNLLLALSAGLVLCGSLLMIRYSQLASEQG